MVGLNGMKHVWNCLFVSVSSILRCPPVSPPHWKVSVITYLRPGLVTLSSCSLCQIRDHRLCCAGSAGCRRREIPTELSENNGDISPGPERWWLSSTTMRTTPGTTSIRWRSQGRNPLLRLFLWATASWSTASLRKIKHEVLTTQC